MNNSIKIIYSYGKFRKKNWMQFICDSVLGVIFICLVSFLLMKFRSWLEVVGPPRLATRLTYSRSKFAPSPPLPTPRISNAMHAAENIRERLWARSCARVHRPFFTTFLDSRNKQRNVQKWREKCTQVKELKTLAKNFDQ